MYPESNTTPLLIKFPFKKPNTFPFKKLNMLPNKEPNILPNLNKLKESNMMKSNTKYKNLKFNKFKFNKLLNNKYNMFLKYKLLKLSLNPYKPKQYNNNPLPYLMFNKPLLFNKLPYNLLFTNLDPYNTNPLK